MVVKRKIVVLHQQNIQGLCINFLHTLTNDQIVDWLLRYNQIIGSVSSRKWVIYSWDTSRSSSSIGFYLK